MASAAERVSFVAATPCNPSADADATVLTHVALTGFSLAVALLFGVGAGGRFVPPPARRLAVLVAAGVSLVLALLVLLAGSEAATLALAPGAPMEGLLRIDALSAPFVALLSLVGLAAAVALPPARHSARHALLLGALLLLLLAADAASFGFALLVALLAGFLPAPGGPKRPGWRRAVPSLAAADETMALPIAGAAVAGFALLLRLLFVLGGPEPPLWWALALLLLGAAGAVAAAFRAVRAHDLGGVAGSAMAAGLGLGAVGLGLALAAKGADLPELSALALGGALLLLQAQALAATQLLLAAAVVGRAAGSTRLDRLGGVMRLLPFTGGGALVATASLAFVPPSAGFAGLWLLLQALLRGLRLGGPWLAVPLSLVLLALTLAVGLLAAAALRAFGIAFLGRPRAPRTAGAEETERPARLALLALAGVCILAGLLPGPLLRLFAPLLGMAGAAGMGGRAGFLVLAARGEGGGYAALGIACLLALAFALVTLVVRRLATPGHRVGPAWESGATSPPWLPFGDPASQCGPESFTEALLAPLAGIRARLGGALRRPLARVWRGERRAR